MKTKLWTILIMIGLALMCLSYISIFLRLSKLENKDPIEIRWLHIEKPGSLGMHLQWWDGEEWRDVPTVENEDLED